MTVDTKSKFTIITQFVKGDDGNLSDIKRFYVQNGKTIPNSESTIPGTSGNSVNPDFCKAQKVAFGDGDHFNDMGGFAQFSKGVAAPMVLVMSLWDDVSVFLHLHPRSRLLLLTYSALALRQHALARLHLPDRRLSR